MKELIEKWGEQLLPFAQELPNGYTKFPRHLLSLLSKYFKFDRLLFFPYMDPNGYGEFHSRRDALDNFSALNIDLKAMREYTRQYYRNDVFARRNLPESLLRQKVVLLEDIMPRAEFEKTEYFRNYSTRYDIHHQACVFLKHNERNVAAINFFRGRQEEPFSSEERMLFSFLSDLVSSHYAAAFLNSINMMVKSTFKLLFSQLSMGVVLLNQQLIVLKANKLANDYCKLMLDNANKDDDTFQRSIYSKDDDNHNVQQVINNIGLELSGDGSTFVQSRVVGDFVFYHNAFLFTNIYGNFETWHFLFITHNRRPALKNADSHFEKLTQRETEILNYVTRGYSNEKICDLLHVSIFTVRTHISNIYKKFGVNSKVELLLKLNQSQENKVV